MKITLHFLLATVCILAVDRQPVFSAEAPTPEKLEYFEARIRPVLVEHCYQCHNSAETNEGELALDHRAAMRQGGQSGPAVVPGRPADSRLLKVIRHEIDDQKMPDGGPKLDDRVIADFEKWIAAGAADPRDQPPSADELAEQTSWEATRKRRKQWWSFQPIRDPAPPQVKDPSWSEHPIDRFVLARLEQAGLKPAPPADPATLFRRLSFALTGLPPTPDQARQFQQQVIPSPQSVRGAPAPAGQPKSAIRTQIDLLLDSPRFGERWARHWMDWIRYAESHGSEGDPNIPHAYRYRDYLIRALNADLPYDQLVREHVAGDLMEQPRINPQLGIVESTVGTGHWRMVQHGFEPVDALDEKVRFIDDQINAFSKAFLGLTVSCARCHDHKFDPISQRDYYALFGILASCRPALLDANVPARQWLHGKRLTELKKQIRNVVADTWLEAAGSIREQLLNPDEQWSRAIDDADQPSNVLHTWQVLRREVTSPDKFPAAWQRWMQKWGKDWQQIDEHQRRDYARRWRLNQPDGYDDWFVDGRGLGDKPSPAGEFLVAHSGNSVVSRIFPAGAYSHRLSSRHRAVLESRRFKLDGPSDLWVRVAGDQQAMARFVVENYPRRGGRYAAKLLKDGNWIWQKYDMDYWDGNHVHLELATARDAPLLVEDKERSWFGIREAVLVKKGAPGPPKDVQEFMAPLRDAALARQPESLEDLAGLYEQAITTTLRNWKEGGASDSQALLLDALLQSGRLLNTMEQHPAARPLVDEYRRLESEIVTPTHVPGLGEAEPFDQPLFIRGNHKQPGDPVPRRFLEAIDPTPYETVNSGRRRLAEDLLRADNPLTARVIVNRLWHHLFGQGLVATPNNLGRLGSEPTHPELLDYLATKFKDDFHWSIKDMIRFMVTCKTWQQSSRPSARSVRVDPDNRRLSHARVRRLEAEAIRDALLAVSGSLDPQMYGSSVEGKSPRRSIYVRVQRNKLDPLLRVFDFPEPFTAVGRRDATNVPAQSLTMLNDPLVIKLARQWADAVLRDASLPDDASRARRLFMQALGREPTPAELQQLTAFLDRDPRRPSGSDGKSVPAEDKQEPPPRTPNEAWYDLAQAIFNFKEFIYIR